MTIPIVLKAEIRRTIQEIKNYWLYTISDILATIIFFFGLSFSIPVDYRGSNLFFLVSILLWYYSLEITNQMSRYILEEKYFGTIEKLFLSPYGPVAVLSSRAFSSILLSTGIVACLFFSLAFAIGVSPFAVTLPMVIVSLITLFGLYGFGLILAGLTIINSRTSSVAYITTYIMLFMSGMVTPLEAFPTGVAYIARLFPLTIGIENLRMVITDNSTVAGLFTHPRLYIGFIYSGLSIIIGIQVFRYAVKIAKVKGILRIV